MMEGKTEQTIKSLSPGSKNMTNDEPKLKEIGEKLVEYGQRLQKFRIQKPKQGPEKSKEQESNFGEAEDEQYVPNLFEEENESEEKSDLKLDSFEDLFLKEITVQDFKRFSLLKMKFKNRICIVGANGSGKTSVLHAIILTLRSYNSKCSNSKRFNEDKFQIHREVYFLLNKPIYAKLFSFDNFIRKSKESKESKEKDIKYASLIGLFNDNISMECFIKGNGKLEIYPKPPNFEIQEKIRFAFVGADAHFFEPYHSGSKEILTSDSVVRKMCIDLFKTELPKKNLVDIMKDLFPEIENIYIKDSIPPKILIEEKETITEVMHYGDAFQKIFVSFILLFTLIQLPEKRKIFLMEEPETFIYSQLFDKFFPIIDHLASKHKIQMIWTSNSSYFNTSYKSNIFLLNPFGESCYIEDNHDAELFFNTRLLNLMNQPLNNIIFCEGSDDVTFISFIIDHLLCKSSRNITFVPNIPVDEKGIAAIHKAIKKISPQIKVIFIKDPDFMDKDLLNQTRKRLDDQKIPLYYWDLPSIESFFFLNYALTCESSELLKLKKDLVRHSSTLTLDFYEGHRQKENKSTARSVFEERFNRELWKNNTNWESVASVIRGHSFVKLVVKKTNSDFYKEWEKDLPGIKQRLNGLVKFVSKLWNELSDDKA